MRAYIILVENKLDGNKVSQEAYKTLREAQRFIETRSDNPKKISEYKYEGRGYGVYTIHEVMIRGE